MTRVRKVDAGTGDTGPAGSVRALDADDVSQALDLLEESRSNDGSESLDRAVDLEKAARALGTSS